MSNQRKTKRQAGLAYVNRQGDPVPEKVAATVKSCCRLQCVLHISEEERNAIHRFLELAR